MPTVDARIKAPWKHGLAWAWPGLMLAHHGCDAVDPRESNFLAVAPQEARIPEHLRQIRGKQGGKLLSCKLRTKRR